MKSRSVSCLRTIILFAILGLCLVVVLSAALVSIVPGRAAQLFGPPDPALDTPTRYYYAAILVLEADKLNVPTNPAGSPQPFSIGLGEPTHAVIQRLAIAGLITDPEVFRVFLLYRGLDKTLQAGEYQLSPAMTAPEIALALQDATPSQVTFNILAGWRLEEIAAALPTSGLRFSPEAFLAAASSPPPDFDYAAAMPANASLEGFLFPAHYEFERDTTVDDFLAHILENFSLQVSPDLQQGFNRQGLDLFQGITLASIVEREAMLVEEMPMIASVFYNRLATGTKLDTDPTVQYALGFNHEQNTWWTNPLSRADLEINSPYNTYLFPGLPPGPIANPGLEALRATAFPAQTPYFYFRSACDGSGRHEFAVSFEEHVGNACP